MWWIFLRKKRIFLRKFCGGLRKATAQKKNGWISTKQTLQLLGYTNEKIMVYQVRHFSSTGYPKIKDWETGNRSCTASKPGAAMGGNSITSRVSSCFSTTNHPHHSSLGSCFHWANTATPLAQSGQKLISGWNGFWRLMQIYHIVGKIHIWNKGWQIFPTISGFLDFRVT